MKRQHTYFKQSLAVLAAFAVWGASASADYVNFTGLSNSGGTFTTAIGGGSIPTVQVGPIGGTGTGTSQLAGGNGTYLRLQDDSPISGGQTMFTSISFPVSQIFAIEADTNSNISTAGDQWVEFTAVNASLASFSWNLTGLANATAVISGANNETIRITPTSSSTFAGFRLSPIFALSGVDVTVSSTPRTSSLNSVQLKLDVIPEPSTFALMSLVLIGAWFFGARRRTLPAS